MPEYNVKLAGWQIAIAAVVLLAVVGGRLMTFNDQRDDAELVEKLKFEIMTEYLPNDVDALRAAVESGDSELIGEVAGSVTSSKITIESVQTSYPLFSFTSSNEVVVKVRYSLDDASGNRNRATNYYLFSHGLIGNTWSYRHKTTVVSYYLNFF